MVKIKVSYEQHQELKKVLKALGPMVKSCKIPKTADGTYKKAYINIQDRE